jgi:hypothetical protein
MPTPAQLTTIQSALAKINPAIPAVQAAVGQTSDPAEKLQLTQFSILLTNIQTALTEAQIATDNGVFAADTAKLNAQAAVLKKQAADIKSILKAVDTAGKIAGYITQVLAFIAKI